MVKECDNCKRLQNTINDYEDTIDSYEKQLTEMEQRYNELNKLKDELKDELDFNARQRRDTEDYINKLLTDISELKGSIRVVSKYI